MVNYAAKIVVVLFLFLLGHIDAVQSKTTLTIAVANPGSSPYLYFKDDTQTYEGVVIDFLSSFEHKEQFDLKFLNSNRARHEIVLEQNKADLFLSNPLWLKAPEKLLFSDMLLLHKTFLYSINRFNTPFSLEDLPKKLVCTRNNYVYPTLTSSFKNERLVRVDSSSQKAMINMLIKGRCDYAVLSEFNATAELNKLTFCHPQIFKSPTSIHDTPLVLALSTRLKEKMSFINQQLLQFKESGELARSIVKHSAGADINDTSYCE